MLCQFHTHFPILQISLKQDNPAVRGDFNSSDGSEDSSYSEDFDSEEEGDADTDAEAEDNDFKVKVKNLLPNTEVDIVLVYDAGEKQKVWEKMFKTCRPMKHQPYGHGKGT